MIKQGGCWCMPVVFLSWNLLISIYPISYSKIDTLWKLPGFSQTTHSELSELSSAWSVSKISWMLRSADLGCLRWCIIKSYFQYHCISKQSLRKQVGPQEINLVNNICQKTSKNDFFKRHVPANFPFVVPFCDWIQPHHWNLHLFHIPSTYHLPSPSPLNPQF